MIVRMSKVQIVGPRPLLDPVLAVFRERGDIHINSQKISIRETGDSDTIQSFLPDERTIVQKFFLEELKANVDELFSFLPKISIRPSYLDPQPILDTVKETLGKHLSFCREIAGKIERTRQELDTIKAPKCFFDTFNTLIDQFEHSPDLDCIGLVLEDSESGYRAVNETFNQITKGSYELFTEKAENGTLVGLGVTTINHVKTLKKTLPRSALAVCPEVPPDDKTTFIQQMDILRKRIAALEADIAGLSAELEKFTHRWGPIYRNVLNWVNERLSIIQVSGSTFVTELCFVICGWMPSKNVLPLDSALQDEFQGQVCLEELILKEEELENVPVVLKNPQYFQPFELLTKFLPLPSYASYDPTPFVGIFFPIFFGIILGDIGYGLVLGVISLFLIFRARNHLLRDAGKILSICSLYTVIFGALYGELLGDLGHRAFGLAPLLINRQKEIVPMIIFAVSIGVAHILLGFLLGAITAFRKKAKKAVFVNLLSIFLLLCIIVSIVLYFIGFPQQLTKPVFAAITLLTVLLLLTGGILAPLEMLSSLGNIISYTRIMAIGLASALLAHVANRIAGLTGDIVFGIIVAGLIHLINLIIGVFSPTIHSLRLHYVEFFDKFLRFGGKKFEPLGKEKNAEEV